MWIPVWLVVVAAAVLVALVLVLAAIIYSFGHALDNSGLF